jgi:HTH-type transcriptional regulator/antitoxin HigA
MRLIAGSTLVAFGERHPGTRPSLAHWMSVAKAANWSSAADVQAAFSKAKALNGERVRFEIAGGDYRVIAAFDFRRGIAFVKFIGTHAEYDRVDALTVSEFQGVEAMDIRPIRTDEDHRAALQEIETLWGAADGTLEGDRLDVLVTLVEAYEDKRWPVEELDPVEAIEAAMAHEGYDRRTLAALIGQSRATEVLQRRRALTLPMIRKIAAAWHVPESVLVKEYRLHDAA